MSRPREKPELNSSPAHAYHGLETNERDRSDVRIPLLPHPHQTRHWHIECHRLQRRRHQPAPDGTQTPPVHSPTNQFGLIKRSDSVTGDRVKANIPLVTFQL